MLAFGKQFLLFAQVKKPKMEIYLYEEKGKIIVFDWLELASITACIGSAIQQNMGIGLNASHTTIDASQLVQLAFILQIGHWPPLFGAAPIVGSELE